MGLNMNRIPSRAKWTVLDDIKSAPEFQHSRQVLEAKKKQLKSQGKGNRPLKSSRIEEEELRLLKEKGELGTGE